MQAAAMVLFHMRRFEFSLYFKWWFRIGMKKLNNNKYVRFIRKYGTSSFRDVIPTKILKENFTETSCMACEFCIKFCEKNNLIG